MGFSLIEKGKLASLIKTMKRQSSGFSPQKSLGVCQTSWLLSYGWWMMCSPRRNLTVITVLFYGTFVCLLSLQNAFVSWEPNQLLRLCEFPGSGACSANSNTFDTGPAFFRHLSILAGLYWLVQALSRVTYGTIMLRSEEEKHSPRIMRPGVSDHPPGSHPLFGPHG